MQSVFKYFKQDAEADLDAEFRRSYQAPGARFLGIASALAVLIFGGFYLLDALNGVMPFIGGIQTFRLVVMVVMGASAFAMLTWKEARQHYTLFANIIIFAALQAAVYVAYHARVQLSYIEMFWGMTSSLSTGFVVVYGFSRLPARNTAVLAASATLTAIAYVMTLPDSHPAQVGRLVVHLVLVNVVAFWLRHNIESRERELFLLAKENLRRNVYTKELEAAKAAAEAAKAAAEDADMAKSRFLANMSHEVRTPMNGVLQILERVSKSVPAQDLELIDKGRRSGEALMRILNGILDYTKLSHGSGQVHASIVSIPETCRTVTELHAAALTTKGLQLKTRLDFVPRDEQIVVDEVKLFEIINNLVANAIKFTESGFVELAVQLLPIDGESFPRVALHIQVRDTGIGISEAEQAKVFTPFYQVDGGANRKAGGTGLGLSIVQELVAILGGTIAIESVAKLGTSIQVALPVEVADAVDVPLTQGAPAVVALPPSAQNRVIRLPRPARPNLLSGRVLLVEDNELNAMLASKSLEGMGLEVSVAENGQVGAHEACEGLYDVVLMDCQMPVMDGYEATRRIRAHESRTRGGRRLPIIALTANTLSGDREKCLDAGMSDYLGKPYTESQLHDLLVRWLDKAEEVPGTQRTRGLEFNGRFNRDTTQDERQRTPGVDSRHDSRPRRSVPSARDGSHT